MKTTLQKLGVDPADCAVLNAEIEALAFEVSAIYSDLSPKGKACAIRLAGTLSRLKHQIPLADKPKSHDVETSLS